MKKTVITRITLVILLMFLSLFPVSSKYDIEIAKEKSNTAQKINDEFINKYLKSDVSFEDVYFAGSYLDDNFDLHIKLKGNNDNIRSIKAEYEQNNSVFYTTSVNVFVEEAEYSELEIMNAYDKLINSELGLKEMISEIAIDYSINGLKIGYRSNISDKEKLFMEVNYITDGFKNITFYPISELPESNEKLTIYGGKQISSGGYSCSVGFAAYRTATAGLGFVTAAHCFGLNSTVNYSGNQVGVVTVRSKTNSNDSEFVEITQPHEVPRTAMYSTFSTNYTTVVRTSSSRPVQGSVIYIYGQNGRYVTTLTSNNASIFLVFSWTNMLKFPEVTVNGDSGGIIIANNYAVGILRGASLGYDYATPSDTALNVLGLTPTTSAW